MLDADLAELYDVPTKVLNQAVKRNKARFPVDFMFQLSNEEFAALRSQIVTLEGFTSGIDATFDPFERLEPLELSDAVEPLEPAHGAWEGNPDETI